MKLSIVNIVTGTINTHKKTATSAASNNACIVYTEKVLKI